MSDMKIFDSKINRVGYEIMEIMVYGLDRRDIIGDIRHSVKIHEYMSLLMYSLQSIIVRISVSGGVSQDVKVADEDEKIRTGLLIKICTYEVHFSLLPERHNLPKLTLSSFLTFYLCGSLKLFFFV